MGLTRQTVSILSRVIQGIGITAWVLGGILMLGWYIEWLDYFLWRLVANALGLLTFPLIPVAVLVEWVWHGWPGDVTVSFLVGLGGIGVYGLGSLVHSHAEKWQVSSGRRGGTDGRAEFSVILVGISEKKKIQVLKEVRAITGLGLKEAKELVDGGRGPIKKGISKNEAETIKKRLQAHGATIEVNQRSGSPKSEKAENGHQSDR